MNNINWELINLNPKKIELLDYLEKETKLTKESYLNDLLNGKSEWIDYEDLRYCLEEEKKPNRKFLSGKEAIDYLRNLYLTNPKNHKHHHGLQL